jgi:spore coat polysaccharide biosynthesis predicted glycosyltransferase SpsG
MPRIACWADCGPGVGLGHVARSATIAAELRRSSDPVVMIPDARGENMIRAAGLAAVVTGFQTVVDEAARCDVVLLDSYRVDRAQTVAVRAAGAAVAVMDDTATDVLPADLIVNGAPGADRLPYDRVAAVEYLIGPRYFPLQHRFRGWPERVIAARVSRVLVTVGGEDVHGLLPGLMRVGRIAFADAQVIGVCGEPGRGAAAGEDIRYSPADYADLVRTADVMICGGGQTLVEAAATGMPAAALALGDDQRPQLGAVAGADACIDAGAWDMPADARERRLQSALSALGDVNIRKKLSRNGRALVDGAGAARIAEAMMALAKRREACR